MKPDASMVYPSKMAESLGVVNGGSGDSAGASSTLTPTTLKCITQFLQSDNCLQGFQEFEETGVPPVVPANSDTTLGNHGDEKSIDSKSKTIVTSSWQGGTTTIITPGKENINTFLFDSGMDVDEKAIAAYPPSTVKEEVPTPSPTAARRSTRLAKTYSTKAPAVSAVTSPVAKKVPTASSKAKKTSGRKPANSKCDEDLSPEEEEKVKLRRLRNKEAAARCRKRRVDLTNSLLEEVEMHQAKKRSLEDEIRMLKAEKEDLEFLLEAHQVHCQYRPSLPRMSHIVAIKSEPVKMEPNPEQTSTKVLVEAADQPYLLPESPKPKRPATLSITRPVTTIADESMSNGIAIETPSTIISNFAFDSLSTGLTPSGPAASIVPVTSDVTKKTATAVGVVTTSSVLVDTLVTPTVPTPSGNCSLQQRSSETSCSTPMDYVTL